MSNDDRLAIYLARVAQHRVADPLGYATRFRRGQMLQALPFPWRLVARGTLLTLRKRRA